MTGLRVFLRFLDREFLTRLLLLLLLYSLLPLAEIVLLMLIGDLVGRYFTLTIAASTGLMGVLVALGQLRRVTSTMRAKVHDGLYPGEEFVGIAGILAGCLLLMTPGFITDLLGFALFVPGFRNMVGRLITKRLDRQLKEIYEYLKLYEP